MDPARPALGSDRRARVAVSGGARGASALGRHVGARNGGDRSRDERASRAALVVDRAERSGMSRNIASLLAVLAFSTMLVGTSKPKDDKSPPTPSTKPAAPSASVVRAPAASWTIPDPS